MEEPVPSLTPETAVRFPAPVASETPPGHDLTPMTLAGEVSSVSVSHIPGYEILGELGRGGMGLVYKARQIGLGRTVALKVVLHAPHAGAEARARFRNEAQAVARLQHLNIVAIYEIGDAGGLPYFSMEYCHGGSLAQRLAWGPMEPCEAARLVHTLALAVQAAHDQQVIHRDLKPGNILLGSDGKPKIADFGLARRTDEAGQTASGAILGTPSYMSPEQARGKVRELGPATDVYALGAILYECLTGRPPFLASSSVDTLIAVVSDTPTPPRQLRPQLPESLESICLSCLEKLQNQRPASARQLADRLDAFLAGQPIQGMARVSHARSFLKSARVRRLAVLGAAPALLLCLAVGVWLFQRSPGVSVNGTQKVGSGSDRLAKAGEPVESRKKRTSEEVDDLVFEQLPQQKAVNEKLDEEALEQAKKQEQRVSAILAANILGGRSGSVLTSIVMVGCAVADDESGMRVSNR